MSGNRKKYEGLGMLQDDFARQGEEESNTGDGQKMSPFQI